MLKYRVIGAFVAVWCAVCLSYVGVRAAVGALAGKTDVSTASVEASSSSVAEDDGGTASPGEDVAGNPTPPVETPAQAPTSVPVETQGQDTTVVEDQIQSEEVLSAPSLDEYLSQYTCGSCRRNCSLDNPRCHNGSRLAELKAQEYYETYG